MNYQIDRMKWLIYVGNLLSVAPFYDFVTHKPKWLTFGKFFNLTILAFFLTGSSYCIAFGTFLESNDILSIVLMSLHYIFLCCLTNFSIAIFTIIYQKQFYNLLYGFIKLNKKIGSTELKFEKNYFQKLYLISTIAFISIFIEFFYELASIKSVKSLIIYEILLLLTYHVTLNLFVTFTSFVTWNVMYVNKALINVENETNHNKLNIKIMKLFDIYKDINHIILLINKLFELPLLMFLIVFATNILIFIHSFILNSRCIFHKMFHVHDLVRLKFF